LNGINSIRLDINTTRYDVARSRKSIVPVGELKSATEADKKKQFIKRLDNNLDLNQQHSNTYSELLSSDSKYYRANLLNEIVNKMSGIEPRHYPGHIVEYYA
jgi:hypothetical protein